MFRLLVKARAMTYTFKNILSAFEATGICPLNERRVLESMQLLMQLLRMSFYLSRMPTSGKKPPQQQTVEKRKAEKKCQKLELLQQMM